mgnify:FL=1
MKLPLAGRRMLTTRSTHAGYRDNIGRLESLVVHVCGCDKYVVAHAETHITFPAMDQTFRMQRSGGRDDNAALLEQ